MSVEIHPSAVVDPKAELGDDVVVGPFAVIGPEVTLGARCRIDAGAQVQGPTVLGEDNHVYAYACVGFAPQDLKFEGERTTLEVGDRNQFREHCTVHRGTAKGGGVTVVGSDNLFMVGTHIAHDCRVGHHTIFANNATLAGHVDVEDHAAISAFSSVHQFCRVGTHAYVGGYSVITRDALPYVKTVGGKPACYGINRIGLERKGFDGETLAVLDRAYRILVRSKLNTSQAVETLREELGEEPIVAGLLTFIEGSERGVIMETPRRNSGRGG